MWFGTYHLFTTIVRFNMETSKPCQKLDSTKDEVGYGTVPPQTELRKTFKQVVESSGTGRTDHNGPEPVSREKTTKQKDQKADEVSGYDTNKEVELSRWSPTLLVNDEDEVSSMENESVEYNEEELAREENNLEELIGVTRFHGIDELDVAPDGNVLKERRTKTGKSCSLTRRDNTSNNKARSSSVGKELNGFSFVNENGKFIDLGKLFGIKMEGTKMDFQKLIRGMGGNGVNH
ncbi:hypothetical protein L1987_39965 [Smallanthus sonchifolius]|uniref:Uncharacterized protein n=1 Tax=Smallanthus sonchifolius TaxID=185202 RepID=A0ACB9GS44_9ASTR|nr:hypothetical protein L1987_39965 [Smallanthus sonchifolius]